MKRVFVIQPAIEPAAAAVFAGRMEVVEPLRGTPRYGEEDPACVAEIRAALDDALPDVHALYGLGDLDADVLERGTRLECVITPSAGAERIDVAAATALGIPVVNAAGAAYVAVAEHALGLVLALAKLIARTDREAHRTGHQRSHLEWRAEGTFPWLLQGARMGVVGFGFIGRSLAQKARLGLEMEVVAHDPFYDPVEAERQHVALVDLDELLATSDVVSVCCALTPATESLVDARALALMKPTAVLVNCARGRVVDTDALVAALEAGAIAGAGLDVSEPEPLPDGHPLLGMENVVLTPHIASVPRASLARLAELAATEGMAVMDGRFSHRLVNRDVWPAFLARRRAGA
jgi:D-3-phosphoglycerate dehydrogenase